MADGAAWVCYVYQNRFVTPMEVNGRKIIRLYDFDPLRVRKACLARDRAAEAKESGQPSHKPKRKDKPRLVTEQTAIGPVCPLQATTKTGADLPYTYVDIRTDAYTALIDSERIVAMEVCLIDATDRSHANLPANPP